MSDKKIFVGRRDEIEQFKKVLERPRGEAVVVVGQAGMGKTWLVNKMAEVAEKHPGLKCGCVRYEVTQTDSVDSTMALMMDNAFEAAQVTEGSFDGTKRRLEQWRGLLNVINIGDLVMSLRRDPQRDTREQFLERLWLISKRMPGNGRAVFIVDPEKYMQEKSDQAWAIVVRELPEKIKLMFAQRPEDVLVESDTFGRLGNVVRIPERRLDVLSEAEVEELVNCRQANLRVQISEAGSALRYVSDLREILGRYKGHPYAIGAALDLAEAGTGLEELPKKGEPIRFAELQWKRVCDDGGDGAVELFEAYAILEAGVPDDVAEAVSGLRPAKRKAVLADKFLAGLLREEGYGRRIYHAILADYILGQIGEKEKKEYHGRAAEVYREKLRKAKKEQIKPDELAAERLAEHVWAAEGSEAFVGVFVNDCEKALLNLGLLDTAISLSERALKVVKNGSEEEAVVVGNLGLIYQTRGELDKAEQMHRKALEIEEKLGRLEGMAGQYGNLGAIYLRRGELDKAEQMLRKALEINEKLGRPEGMAIQYGNLGLIYKTRGELDKAEQMLKKSLEIEERLGRLEGMANQYGNLGLIYQGKGQLDEAEKMYLKVLKIEERLGRPESVANAYGNLGAIYKERGDIKKAREYWVKGRDLFVRIGMPIEVKLVEGLIEGLDGAGS
jgi:tetratricopeptide (TPR) repeat protein